MDPEGQQNNGLTDMPSVDSGMNTTGEMNSQTSAVSTDDSAATMPPASRKKKFSKKSGLIAAAAIAVLALAGSVSAYQFWYQNPDKVMADAISHVIAAKQSRMTGDVAIDTEDVKITMALKINGDEQNSNVNADVVITPKTEETKFLGDIKLGAETVMAANGDIYFKIKDLKPVVDNLLDTTLQMQVTMYEEEGYEMSQSEINSLRSELSKTVDPVINKIDNKWIKVTADDLKQDGDDEQACIMDAVEKINNDEAMRRQLVDAYKKNKFILVDKELGVRDGNVGYQLKIDEAAAETFGKDIQNTSFGSELKKCDEDIFKDTSDTLSPATDDSAEVTTEIWITRWSHQLTALKININDKEEKVTGLLDLDFAIGVSDEVTIPSDATSITELQADITELMSGAAGASSLSI